MWRFLKKIQKRFWALVALLLWVVGLGGVPGSLTQWSVWINVGARWINAMIDDLFVMEWAARAVRIAEYINQPAVRVGLFVLGCVIFAWPLRWFWRIRRKVRLFGRSILENEIWLDESDAFEELRTSDWARLKEPHVVHRHGFLNIPRALTGEEVTVSGMSETEKDSEKYKMYLRATLLSFQASNSSAVRSALDGSKEIEITALRKFLQAAVNVELQRDYGDIPVFNVT